MERMGKNRLGEGVDGCLGGGVEGWRNFCGLALGEKVGEGEGVCGEICCVGM